MSAAQRAEKNMSVGPGERLLEELDDRLDEEDTTDYENLSYDS